MQPTSIKNRHCLSEFNDSVLALLFFVGQALVEKDGGERPRCQLQGRATRGSVNNDTAVAQGTLTRQITARNIKIVMHFQ